MQGGDRSLTRGHPPGAKKHLADLEITSWQRFEGDRAPRTRWKDWESPLLGAGNTGRVVGTGEGWKWEPGEQETAQGIGVGAQLALRIWGVTNWQ